jgi:Ferritin-like domain
MDDFSFDRLDVDGALAESLERTGLSRAAFLTAALGGSTALLGSRTIEDALGQTGGLPTNDVFILNYALVLEYLQAAFYTEAERMGALRGRTARAAEVVGSVERAHVEAFKNVLGRKAVKRPTFDFQGTTEDGRAFLKTAVAFEDLAVAAYKGQAPRLKAKPALASALAIHSVEARHAAWMRYLFDVNPAQSAFDQPQSRPEVTRVVQSTNFITGPPAMDAERSPTYIG